MTYVALLRGINVGGRNLLRMVDLRVCLERRGFRSVSTYIQSGNVIFESDLTDRAKLTTAMRRALTAEFGYDSPILVRSRDQLKAVVARAPREWKSRTDLRRYVAFLREPLTAKQALKELDPKHGVDFVKAGDGVLYMSTLLRHLKQSGFTKVVGKEIYRDMTIRNYGTCQKILALMQREPEATRLVTKQLPRDP
jgi:uncharacterized protein (DUF1697 family)